MVLGLRRNSSPPRPPERAQSEIQKHHYNCRRGQKSAVIGPVQPTGPRAPQRRGAYQRGQKEQNPGHFQPQDAAHASKRPQKSAHSPGHGSPCSRRIDCRSCRALRRRLCAASRIGPRRGARSGNRLCCLGLHYLGLRRACKPLAGNASRHAQPDAQRATNRLRLHPYMMVAAIFFLPLFCARLPNPVAPARGSK
jgi:hypothetical protein